MDLGAPIYEQAVIPISDPTRVGEARRTATRAADLAGMGEVHTGHAGIIATELATNLLRYARAGELLIQQVSLNGETAIDFTAVDRGPGIGNVAACIQDGFSTGGTTGTGLGAVRRLATEFDIHSAQPAGTVVYARLAAGESSTCQVGVFSRPFHGEIVNGDGWRVSANGSTVSILVADGLGHGLCAAEASAAARASFLLDPFRPPGEIIARQHQALMGTRGAAIMVAQIDVAQGRVTHSGIGNIGASIVTPTNSRGLVSLNGIVGVQMRRVQSFENGWTAGSRLIMHSDGLRSKWDLGDATILYRHHPAVIAGLLGRDFARGTDDLTVVVVGAGHA